jgi:hypothetical protein
VGVVAALLLAALLHGVDLRPVTGAGRSGGRSAAAVVDSAPIGVAPSAVRTRTSGDTELLSLLQSSKTRWAGLAAASLSGLVALAAAWWCRSRPDRHRASPRRRASLAPLRAPPAPLTA